MQHPPIHASAAGPASAPDLVSASVHAFGLALALWFGARLVLDHAAQGNGMLLAGTLVFSGAACALFFASVMCHSLRGRPMQRWERLDQAATFVLTAATCTPFLLVAHHTAALVVLGGVWAVALGAVAWQLGGRSRLPPASLYAGYGWFCVVVALPCAAGSGAAAAGGLLGGAALYSVGTLFYRNPYRWRHAHAVWHLFVLAGAAAHYLAIWHLARPVAA